MVSPRRIIGKGAATDPTLEVVVADENTGIFNRVATGGAFAVYNYTTGKKTEYGVN